MKVDLGRALNSLGIDIDGTTSDTFDINSFLSEMDQSLHEAGKRINGLQKRNGILRNLALQTRISSRHSGINVWDFDIVATSLKELESKINEKTSAIQCSLNALCTKIRTRKKRLNEFVIREISHSIEILNKTHEQCSSLSKVISGQSVEIAKNIAGVVSSIQYHDISRQKMEHARDALVEICAESRKRSGEVSFAGHGEEIGEMCELLIEQLHHVNHELDTAIRTMESNLKTIADTSLRVDSNASRLSGEAGDMDNSSLTVVDQDLSAAVSYLLKDVEVEEEHLQLIQSIVETIGEIHTFLEGIEEIGEEIELIALNSTVKALRLKSAGSGIRVIVTAIKSESDAICKESASISEQFLMTTAKAEQLKEVIEEAYCFKATEKEGIELLLNEKLLQIQESNRGIRELVQLVQTSTIRLRGLVADAMRSVAAAADLPTVLSKNIIPSLENSVQEVRKSRTPAGEKQPEGFLLDKLRGAYTMNFEREVHDRYLSGQGVTKGKQFQFKKRDANVPLQTFDEENLGANVELF
jgi:hypothetical protein